MLSLLLCAACPSQIDLAEAQQAFALLERQSGEDAGAMWDQDVGGPMLFLDRRTRQAVGNTPSPSMKAQGGVFVGRWPDERPISNTGVDWDGVRWATVAWPLPATETDRARLLLHESFHRIQPQLGLPMANETCPHLESLEGRVWMRMEWRALEKALRSDGDERALHLENAFHFRRERHRRCEGSAASERGMELHEGLAEYTGFRLCGLHEDRDAVIASHLAMTERSDSFARRFAYASGPAWGSLIDALEPEWTLDLDIETDLGAWAAEAYGRNMEALTPAEFQLRASAYGHELLRQQEEAAERDRQERRARYRKLFDAGPYLSLPLGEGVRYSFDPTQVEPLDELRTIYPVLTVNDAWGGIVVRELAMLIRGTDGSLSELRVPLRANTALAVPPEDSHWKLTLANDWSVVEAGAPGRRTLVRQGP